MKGLSLLECLIVTLLTTMMLALSLPSLREVQRLSLLKKEIRQIEYRLHILASRARAAGDPQTFYPHQYPELTSSREKILFYPTGAASAATMILADDQHSCSLTLSLRGRTRIVCS